MLPPVEGIYSKKKCGRCGLLHFERQKTCVRCRIQCRDNRFKRLKTATGKIKESTYARNYRKMRAKDPNFVEHRRRIQTEWRRRNPTALKIWKQKEKVRLEQERQALDLTYTEHRFYTKLVTTLFRAGVEW